MEWSRKQHGYGLDGYQIDKDLFWDKHIYSEQTCCFIPKNLNILMQGIGTWRNGELTGASLDKRCKSQKWRATGFENYKQVWLGVYSTQIEAHNQWKLHKAGVLEKYLENNQNLDLKIKTGLINLIADLRFGLESITYYKDKVKCKK